MNADRWRPLRLAAVAAVLLVAGILGVIGSQLVNAFVLDRYDAYGEVAIPGSGRLHLPAGEVTASFHTRIIGSTDGRGLPVPPLRLTIVGPPGAAEPEITESIGTTITVNNDARVRVCVLAVPVDGDYQITVGGEVGGFVSPRLAFGYRGSADGWVWGLVAALAAGVGAVAVALRRGRRTRGSGWIAAVRRWRTARRTPAEPADRYVPTDEGVRQQQLKTIAALRDSGAMTAAEFDAEKRRILRGG